MSRRSKDAQSDFFPGFTEITEVGAGDLATVYRAREVDSDRLVALKLINTRDRSPRALESFEREASLLGPISSHPNIVTLYGSFPASDGRPVLVLELCRGSVADRLNDGHGLPVRDVVSIGIKIAGALETAHRAGILHRDVKPQNMLTTSFGEPALADFGVAQLKSSTQVTAGLFDFTTLHAAPEMLEGGETSAATDVYELASSLYQLISGKSAFRAYDGESPASVILRILRDPVQPLVSAEVPHDLSALLVRAMSKERGGRPGTAEDFAAELARIEAAQGWARTNCVIGSVGADDAAELAGAADHGSGDTVTGGSAGGRHSRPDDAREPVEGDAPPARDLPGDPDATWVPRPERPLDDPAGSDANADDPGAGDEPPVDGEVIDELPDEPVGRAPDAPTADATGPKPDWPPAPAGVPPAQAHSGAAGVGADDGWSTPSLVEHTGDEGPEHVDLHKDAPTGLASDVPPPSQRPADPAPAATVRSPSTSAPSALAGDSWSTPSLTTSTQRPAEAEPVSPPPVQPGPPVQQEPPVQPPLPPVQPLTQPPTQPDDDDIEATRRRPMADVPFAPAGPHADDPVHAPVARQAPPATPRAADMNAGSGADPASSESPEPAAPTSDAPDGGSRWIEVDEEPPWPGPEPIPSAAPPGPMTPMGPGRQPPLQRPWPELTAQDLPPNSLWVPPPEDGAAQAPDLPLSVEMPTATGPVPTWVFRSPPPSAAAGPDQSPGELTLDPASLRNKVTVRAGGASLTIDDQQLVSRRWLGKTEIPWRSVQRFEPRFDGGAGAGRLVAITDQGVVELPATKGTAADLRYVQALLAAYRQRAMSGPPR